MKLQIITIAFFALFQNIAAQTVAEIKAQLETTYQQYLELEDFELEMTVSVYKGWHNDQPEYENKAVVKKQGTNYFYDYDMMTYLNNSNCMVLIDKEGKEVLYKAEESGKGAGKKKNKSGRMNAEWEMPGFTEQIAQCDSVKLITEEGGQKCYRFYGHGPMVKDMEVTIDKNGWVSDIRYYYVPGLFDEERVEIAFTKMNTQPKFEENAFSEDRFVTIKKEEVSLNASLEKYELTILTDQEWE